MKKYAIAVALVFVTSGALAQSTGGHGDHGSVTKTEKRDSAHRTTGVVKRVDAKAGTVSIAHDPVKTLNWPPMTMNFRVSDKAMLAKLSADRKVEFEFEQRGKDYVITSVK